MVGTGPFKQTDFQRDVSLTTARNENYYETGKPYLDGVKYLYVTDELTRVALFKSGGAEVLNTSGNPKTAKELEAAGYKIISQVGGASVLVPDSLNPNSPWSNLKVRQAAEYAMDREALAKAFGYGYWQAAYQIQSPLSLAFDSNLAGRKFDVTKAKQLLTEAGFTDGFKTNLIVATGGNNDIPTMIQSYLSKVGIQAELQLVEPAKYQQYLSGSWENGILLNPLMQWANPNTTFNFFFGVPGSFFQKTLKKPDTWKDILTASLITPAPDAAATKKMEDAAYDDVMVIPLYYGASIWAVTDKVHDSGLATRGAPTWWEPQNAWLSK
jgi:peptide/nickel transport system substrate-binding protein